MSNEELHIDGDFTLNIPHFEADFTENEQPDIQADFKIQTGGSTSFANITGDPYDNEALSDALNQKADNSTVETLSETVENNYAELDGKITDESDARTQADADLQSNIDDVADDLSIETDNRQTADADLQDNIDTVDGKIDTHIADKSNPHEVTKAQIGLSNVDNTSDLNKPISTATQTALNGKQNTISDLSEIRTNASNGQSAYNTIQTYGDIVTYDASNFATSIQGQKADTALQPNDNITLLNNNAGFITGINSSDVITALGYTPYDSTNPNGYTSNIGTVTSVNNTQPDANGDVTLTIPTVNDGILTITQNGTSKGTFSANQSINDTIALTDTTYNAFTGADGTNAGSSGLVPAPSATDNDKYLKGDGTWASVSGGSSTDVQINGTSITSNNIANILTESAYSASNKIATMSDLPADEIFVATYGVTTLADIITAFNAGKLVYCINNAVVSYLYTLTSTFASFTTPMTSEGGVTWFIRRATKWESGYNSFANTRFDGQWVQSFATLMESSGKKNGVELSLASYLPSDKYKYNVKFRIFGYDDDSTYYYHIETDIFNSGSTATGKDASTQIAGGTYSRQNVNIFDLPVGTGRYIKVYGSGADEINIYALGYRRIGTNT